MSSFTKYLTMFLMALVSTAAATTPSQAITGGTLVQRGELPFLRKVESFFSSSGWGLCSGALISERWILTGAHCAINYKGEKATKAFISESNSKGQTIKESIYWVTDVYYPSDYLKYIPQFVDIAVLKLEKDIPNSVPASTLLTAKYALYFQETEDWRKADPNVSPKESEFETFLRYDQSQIGDELKVIPQDKDGNFIAHAAGYGSTNCLLADDTKCQTNGRVLWRVKLKLSQLSLSADRKLECTNKKVESAKDLDMPFCYPLTAESLADKPKKIDDTLAYGQNQGDSGGPLFVYNESQEPVIIGVSCCVNKKNQYNVNLALVMKFLQGVYDPEGPFATEVEHFQLQPGSI